MEKKWLSEPSCKPCTTTVFIALKEVPCVAGSIAPSTSDEEEAAFSDGVASRVLALKEGPFHQPHWISIVNFQKLIAKYPYL
jgi:hypothetical protein